MSGNSNWGEEIKVRAGFIGCGRHSFGWVYPALRFAPIELVATCDLVVERAARYARQFGAERFYSSHQEMLERESLEAVFIVTGFDEEKRPTYPRLAAECMRAGCHVWMEKPPAASSAEIEGLIRVEQETGKFAMVGFKKCFYPAIEKVKEIITREEFGKAQHIYVRYPRAIPREDEKSSLKEPELFWFLDHICHPVSILVYLMGPAKTLMYRRAPNGSGFALLEYASGAVGCLDFAAGQSGTSFLERLEVIGEGANVVVDNGVRLTYYRRGGRGGEDYATGPSYIGADDGAPLYWEPQFSVASMDAKGLALEGFIGEVNYFAECVIRGQRPQKAGMKDALAIMRIYEAFLQPEGSVVNLQPDFPDK
jgi:predicted dehydrogenase